VVNLDSAIAVSIEVAFSVAVPTHLNAPLRTITDPQGIPPSLMLSLAIPIAVSIHIVALNGENLSSFEMFIPASNDVVNNDVIDIIKNTFFISLIF
jgi:hypothetical protein